MNPETKIILEEMGKRFDAMYAKWESLFADREESWNRKVSDLESSHGNRLAALEQSTEVLPAIEGTVDDIRLEVTKLTKH